MLKLILTIFLFTQIVCYSQNITIDVDYKVDAPKFFVKIGKELIAGNVQDALMDEGVVFLYCGKSEGFSATAFEVEFNEKIIPKALIWADGPIIEGKNRYYFEIEYYDLTLNGKTFNINDTIRGEVYLRTKPSKFHKNQKIVLNGSFEAIVKPKYAYKVRRQ